MTPTEAEHEARRIVGSHLHPLLFDVPPNLKRSMIEQIAAALAAARAQALEEAAKVCGAHIDFAEDDHDPWNVGFRRACEDTAAAIRNLSPQEPQDAT